MRCGVFSAVPALTARCTIIHTYILALRTMSKRTSTVLRLLEFTDSAFPVGTFSFSCGLETAAFLGLVHDAATLEEYTRDVATQAAFTDGISALHSYRSYRAGDYGGVLDADAQTILCKMNSEARLMSCPDGQETGRIERSYLLG